MIFDSGVQGYVHGAATVTVHFPINWRGEPDVRCEMCPYYGRQSRMCQIKKRVLPCPDKYIGPECPLNFGEENNNP